MTSLNRNYGFSLVELMVALLLSSILLLGVGGAYAIIKHSLDDVHALENAQEVLRGSRDILSRSAKQASLMTVVNSNSVLVEQRLTSTQAISCTGSIETANFTERYAFVGDSLKCSVNGQALQTVVKGITALNFSLNGTSDLLSVRIAPIGLPSYFPQADLNEDGVSEAYIRLEFALKSLILKRDT